MLRSIGAFFGKIWAWIKNTAWVQPLLIVGILFGVIFSIPAIANGINGLVESSGTAKTFYENYQVSLNGGSDSDAQKLANYINNEEHGDGDPLTLSGGKKKFILMFVAEECEGCTKAFDGFKLTTDTSKWGKTYIPKDGQDFKLITIFTDEKTDDTSKANTAFDQFLDRNTELLELAAEVAWTSDYYINDKITNSDISNLEKGDHDNFVTPTCILYELGGKDGNESKYFEPTEVMFQVGDGDGNSRANTITDFWNHKGDFCKDGKRE